MACHLKVVTCGSGIAVASCQKTADIFARTPQIVQGLADVIDNPAQNTLLCC